jgi:uncharacterized protein YbjT (DUF2867 family)
MTDPGQRNRVLLTGASGFIGRNAYLGLCQAGFTVRCGSRDPAGAGHKLFGREWALFDPTRPATMAAALEGCGQAVYLLQGVGGLVTEAEVAEARAFREAADAAGIERIVHLEPLPPRADPSPRFQAAAAVREALSAGRAGVITLRPSLVVGYGSWRWGVFRDLAARMPVMLLPRWLRVRVQPVAVEDVAAAIAAALRPTLPAAGLHALPGPEVFSLREVVTRTAAHLGMRPIFAPLPLHVRRTSERWMGLVTRAGREGSRALMDELAGDVIADSDRFWSAAGIRPRRFDEAAAAAVHMDPAPGQGSVLEIVSGGLSAVRARVSLRN